MTTIRASRCALQVGGSPQRMEPSHGRPGRLERLCLDVRRGARRDRGRHHADDHDRPRGVLCSSDSTSGAVEDLQFTLGEGPCVDACRSGLPVFEPDLAAPGVSRWPAFTPPAMLAGVRAIFGFPLQVGSVRLGALDLYNDQPGDLRPEQVAEAVNTPASSPARCSTCRPMPIPGPWRPSSRPRSAPRVGPPGLGDALGPLRHQR